PPSSGGMCGARVRARCANLRHWGRRGRTCSDATFITRQMTDANFSIARNTPVLLAPMAGISDLPFRALSLRFGATAVVSEMIASADMVNAKPSVRARAELGLDEARTAVQLAGREAHWMADAARRCAGQ